MKSFPELLGALIVSFHLGHLLASVVPCLEENRPPIPAHEGTFQEMEPNPLTCYILPSLDLFERASFNFGANEHRQKKSNVPFIQGRKNRLSSSTRQEARSQLAR
jgi:hypothetical protein